MRLFIFLFLLALLVVESMCYYYEAGDGLWRKRSPRYPNFGGGNTGNRLPIYGGGSFPNYGGVRYQNYGRARYQNYRGGNYPNNGGGNYTNYGGGRYPNNGGGSFPGSNDPEIGGVESSGEVKGEDGVIAEASNGNTKFTGIRVGNGTASGRGKVTVQQKREPWENQFGRRDQMPYF